jgi:hypothetical protein
LIAAQKRVVCEPDGRVGALRHAHPEHLLGGLRPQRQDRDLSPEVLLDEERLLERVVVRFVDLKREALLDDRLLVGADLEIGLGGLGHALHADHDVHREPTSG